MLGNMMGHTMLVGAEMVSSEGSGKAPYATFSALKKAVGSMNNDITGNPATSMVKFYRYWNHYLHPESAFMAALNDPLGAVAKACYSIVNSLEHVFNNMFKLVGLFGYLDKTNNDFGKFYQGFIVLGVAVFTLLLVARVMVGLVGKRFKYKAALNNVLLVTCVVSFLPWAVTQVSTAMAKDVERISNTNTSNSDFSSLALQPIINNVVDTKVLIDNDFDASRFPMDDTGYIKPTTSNSTAVNKITDAAGKQQDANYVGQLDFGATYGVTDTKALDTLEQKHPGLKGLFEHRINDAGDGVTAMSEHSLVNAFDKVYPRYTVNWIAMFAQFIVLAALLALMALKVVKSMFETLVTVIIAPIVGYSSVSSSKKFKELLMSVFGGFAGLFFEILILRIMMEIMRDLPTLTVSGVSQMSGNFFDGLNMWEKALASILLYAGIFLGAMQGVTIIERWLGVSTGHSDTMQQLIGGMMLANGAAQVGGAAMHSAAAGLGAAGKVGAFAVTKAPGILGSAAKKGGLAVMATGGALNATKDSIKSQGLKATAANGLNAASDKAVGGLKNGVQAVGDKIHSADQSGLDKYQQAYDQTHGTLSDPEPNYTGTDTSGDDALNGPAGSGPDDPAGPTGYGVNDPTGTNGTDGVEPGPQSEPINSTGGGLDDPSSQADNGASPTGPDNSPEGGIESSQPESTEPEAAGGLSSPEDTISANGPTADNAGGLYAPSGADGGGDVPTADYDNGGLDAPASSDLGSDATVSGSSPSGISPTPQSASASGTTQVTSSSTPQPSYETNVGTATPVPTASPSGIETAPQGPTQTPSGSSPQVHYETSGGAQPSATPLQSTQASISGPTSASQQPIASSPQYEAPVSPTQPSGTTNYHTNTVEQQTSTPASQPSTPKTSFTRNELQKARQDMSKVGNNFQQGGQQAFSGRSAIHGVDLQDDDQG